MKAVKYVLFVAMISVVTGCAGMGTRVGGAMIVMNKEGSMATTEASATKTGTACSQNILGIYAGGDSSIATAKASAGITRVASVDWDQMSILSFYAKVCVIVKGN